MIILKILLLLILATIIGVFAVHNHQYVDISFYPFDLTISIAMFFLVFGAMLFGVLLAWIICYAKISFWRKAAKKKTKENETLQKELSDSRVKHLTYDNTVENLRIKND